MKIVYNADYGGFNLSEKAIQFMAERGHEGAITALSERSRWGLYFYDVERDDPLLIEAVETLGQKEASGSCAKLAIQEIPDGAQWEIDEYDGNESVVPPRQSWY